MNANHVPTVRLDQVVAMGALIKHMLPAVLQGLPKLTAPLPFCPCGAAAGPQTQLSIDQLELLLHLMQACLHTPWRLLRLRQPGIELTIGIGWVE